MAESKLLISSMEFRKIESISAGSLLFQPPARFAYRGEHWDEG